MTKALTLHQPWASLIACGAKTIETRSWSTSYRGPLLIHAAATPAAWNALDEPSLVSARGPISAVLAALPGVMIDATSWHSPYIDEDAIRFSGLDLALPLGAIVVSCTLTDVVPIVEQHDHAADFGTNYVTAGSSGTVYLWQPYDQEPHTENLRDYPGEGPFGDYSAGRFAWLLDDVKPTTERCPACWSGPWSALDVDPCICHGIGACEPIPARGHQGLWTWTP